MELKTLLKRTTILASVITTGVILTNMTVSHADGTTYNDCDA